MTNLLLGFHLHQPTSNLDVAIREAVEQCYRPFFQTMRRYPSFRFALHSSGWILNHIRRYYSDVFEDIAYLAKQGSIEFFGGGYYEPILASIPSNDRVAQIEQLNAFYLKYFGVEVKGLWLTERVWDSSIISDIAQCGIEYIMVDDYHFFASGYKNLEGYYISEDEGNKVGIFPINQALRYALPFENIDNAINTVKNHQSAIVFDDLEKFGLWPNTHEWVYNQGWLAGFVERVLGDEMISTVHYQEFHQTHTPTALVYLQNVSYMEMSEWSLQDASMQHQFLTLEEKLGKESAVHYLRGGQWKNFFIKYPESNRIHKRMLELSKKELPYRKPLYKAQTNDVLWHGVFGGIYLPNLRDNAYYYLIECENSLYQEDGIEVSDTEMQGYMQIKSSTQKIIARFAQKGGALIEFDNRAKKFNFQNTMQAKEEIYHAQISFENTQDDYLATIHQKQFFLDESYQKLLEFDTRSCNSFVDYYLDGQNNITKRFDEEIFDYAISEDKRITFTHPNLTKSIDTLEDGFAFRIDAQERYMLSFNLHFALYERLTIQHESNRISIHDGYTGLNLIFSFNQDVIFKHSYYESLSKSEVGFDKMIQSIRLEFIFEAGEIGGSFLCQA